MKLKQISFNWTASDILHQKGIFALDQVCLLLPISQFEIRFKALYNLNSKKEMGVWLEEGIWVVDMQQFYPWFMSWAGIRSMPAA